MFQDEENDLKWNVTFTITEGSVQQKNTMFAILDSINRTWHEQKNAELKKKDGSTLRSGHFNTPTGNQ